MSDFLDFIFGCVFALDHSKPIERTWKGFVSMICFSLLIIVGFYGVIAILIFRYYIQGVVAIFTSIMIAFLWYHIYRRFYKDR